MSAPNFSADDTFERRFDEFVTKFHAAASYGSPNAMHELRIAMRLMAEKAGGPHFSSFYREFAREVAGASALSTELGRSKRLRDKAEYYVYRLQEGHRQDVTR